jgi:hypothetical protein
MPQTVRTSHGTYEIRSEAHGPHWVAWLVGGTDAVAQSVVVIGQTQAEAEARAKQWVENR